MRKIFALMLVITLFTVPFYTAVALDVDLGVMTDEDLTALKQQLDAEMLERNIVKTAILSVGVYKVGVDIPKGDYNFGQENQSGYSAFLIFESKQEIQANNFIEAHGLRVNDIVKGSLVDGQLLKIEGGTVRITSFSGIHWE